MKHTKILMGVAILFGMSACASSNSGPRLTRTDDNGDRLSIESPEEVTPLQITLRSEVSDSGQITPSVEIKLVNQPDERGQNYWNELLGDRFNITIGNRTFSLELDRDIVGEFSIVPYAPFVQIEEFENLHDQELLITDPDGKPIVSGTAKTPQALGKISLGYGNLYQDDRIISHCQDLYPQNAPPGLYWEGTGTNPLRIFLSNGIYNSNPILVDDEQLWIPNKQDLAPLFDSADIEQAEAEGGYFYLPGEAQITMLRTKFDSLTTTVNKAQAVREIPIEARVVESINYYVDYYGGCE